MIHCIWTCGLVFTSLIDSFCSVSALILLLLSEHIFHESSCGSFWLQLVPTSLTARRT